MPLQPLSVESWPPVTGGGGPRGTPPNLCTVFDPNAVKARLTLNLEVGQSERLVKVMHSAALVQKGQPSLLGPP